ncbi:MAG: hypothetical protein ACF8XB_08430 [Planctomycetota bacterium JB042]
MTAGERLPDPDGEARVRVAFRLLVLFLVLLTIDAGLWFAADFGAMVPPSEGKTGERLYFTAVTALGPISWTVHGFGIRIRTEDDVTALALAVFLAALPTLAILSPHRRWLQPLAILAVVAWFLAGPTRTSLRVP